MFSKNLILAGILAAGLASADVPLSVERDATYALTESAGIANNRNLRAMVEPIASGMTQTSLCNNIGGNNGQLANGAQLLDLDVILSIGANNAQACCNACANNLLCIAFNFQSDACQLARSREGLLGNLIDLNALVDLSIL